MCRTSGSSAIFGLPLAPRRSIVTCSSARARARLRRWRQVRHIIIGLRYHRRRPRGRAPGAGGAEAGQTGRRFTTPLPQILRNVRYKTGKPLENAKARLAIRTSSRSSTAGPAGDPSVGTEPVIRVRARRQQVLVEMVRHRRGAVRRGGLMAGRSTHSLPPGEGERGKNPEPWVWLFRQHIKTVDLFCPPPGAEVSMSRSEPIHDRSSATS
jgi:hypothetical protein